MSDAHISFTRLGRGPGVHPFKFHLVHTQLKGFTLFWLFVNQKEWSFSGLLGKRKVEPHISSKTESQKMIRLIMN